MPPTSARARNMSLIEATIDACMSAVFGSSPMMSIATGEAIGDATHTSAVTGRNGQMYSATAS